MSREQQKQLGLQVAGQVYTQLPVLPDSSPETRYVQTLGKRLDAGETIKFDFRVNDNGGPSYELASERSVSKANSTTFHNDWQTHWSNELEFAFEK